MMNNTTQHTDKPVKQVIAEIMQDAKKAVVAFREHPIIFALCTVLSFAITFGIYSALGVFDTTKLIVWYQSTSLLEKIIQIGLNVLSVALAMTLFFLTPKIVISSFRSFRLLPVKVENAIIQAPVKAFDYICSLFIKGKK